MAKQPLWASCMVFSDAQGLRRAGPRGTKLPPTAPTARDFHVIRFAQAYRSVSSSCHAFDLIGIAFAPVPCHTAKLPCTDGLQAFLADKGDMNLQPSQQPPVDPNSPFGGSTTSTHGCGYRCGRAAPVNPPPGPAVPPQGFGPAAGVGRCHHSRRRGCSSSVSRPPATTEGPLVHAASS